MCDEKRGVQRIVLKGHFGFGMLRHIDAVLPRKCCRLSLKNPIIFSSVAWAVASTGRVVMSRVLVFVFSL